MAKKVNPGTERDRLLTKLINYINAFGEAVAAEDVTAGQPAELLTTEQLRQRASIEGRLHGIALTVCFLQDVRDGKVTL